MIRVCPLARHYWDNVQKLYNKENGTEQPEVQPSELVEHAAQVVENLCQAANLSQAEHILLAATPEQRSTEPYMRIQAGILVAERKVQSLVTLVVDEGTEHEAKLGKSIKESPAAAVRGSCESNQYVAIVVDSKVLCESGSQGSGVCRPLGLHRSRDSLDHSSQLEMKESWMMPTSWLGWMQVKAMSRKKSSFSSTCQERSILAQSTL